MTPDRIAAIRAEFERLNGPKLDNEIANTLEEHFEKKFLRRAWESELKGFLLAHTSSEMSKDAGLYRALLDSGKYAPDRSGYWALQCGPRYEYPKAEMDAAINHAIKEQSNGTS